MAKTNWQMGDTVKPADMNDIGQEINDLRNDVDNIHIPPASLTEAGVVKLNNAINSTSDVDAATPSAVKQAYDKANAAETNAKSYTDNKPWQKRKLTDESGISINVSNGNANNLVAAGFYVGENIANAPVSGAGQWYYINVIAMASGVWVKQEAMNLFTNTYQMRTGSDAGGGVISWGPWTQDLFTSVANGKQAIATAISGKGVPASGSDEFAVLASKISQISTGMKFANGGLGNSYYGTISNLPFTPKALFIGVYASKTGLSASGYAGAILQGSTIVLNGGISASDSNSIDVKLTNLNFGSNFVSFELTDQFAQARSYIVFGE
ncbi:pyocin knob domain-containing protein [Paenibacillus lautus]|uniref:pyocin knob domain-containing protein n=1 Tax=Paenibacillus lautus TaxID=1401 RepID=UPI003D270B7A